MDVFSVIGYRLSPVALALVISCAPSESRLEVMDASATGISFSNDISFKPNFSILDYMYFFNGGGVGIGDFNNDGLEDLFFAGNLVTSELYLNRGSLTFEKVTEAAGLTTSTWCTGVLIEDFNQDGWLDIYLSTSGYPISAKRKNLLFINNQDLTFTESAEAYQLAYEDYSSHAAVLDYDLDGDLDIYLLNHTNQFNNVNDPLPRKLNGEAQNTDRLLRCDWLDSLDHPVYKDVSREAGISIEGFGLGVGVSDLNNDGWPDIYVSNDFVSNDLMYLNQGDGTFINAIPKALNTQSFNGMGNDLADLNNDGLTDIMVVDMKPTSREGEMNMANPISTDLQLTSDLMGYERQYPRNTVQLNQGNIEGVVRFSEVGRQWGLEASDWSWAPLLVDLDLDGRKDVFITNGYLHDITNLDFISYRKQRTTFRSKAQIDSAYYALVQQLPSMSHANQVFLNKSEGFTRFELNWESTLSNGAAWGDLDLDGDADLVVNNINAPAGIVNNNFTANGNFLRFRLQGSERNRRGIGAKVQCYSDGNFQEMEYYLSRGYLSTMGEWQMFGLGDASIIDSVVVTWSHNSSSAYYDVETNRAHVFSYDESTYSIWSSRSTESSLFDSDHKSLDFVHKENAFVDFHQYRLLPWKYSNSGPDLVVADINKDGKEDFYVTGPVGMNGSFFVQSSNGFQEMENHGTPAYEEVAAVFADFNQDAYPDLYIVSGGIENAYIEGGYQDQYLLNDGLGNFTAYPEKIATTTEAGSGAIVFDFDRDGDADIYRMGAGNFEQYGKSVPGILLRNEGGKLVKVEEEKAPQLSQVGMVSDGMAVDFDLDGWDDLILVGEWMNISLCRNLQGRGFETIEIPNSSGIWSAVEASDFDLDGDVDFILGNLGCNTSLRASSERPLSFFTGLLDKNGSFDVVFSAFQVSQSGVHRNFPIHRRTELLSQMPALKSNYPNYDSYSRSTTEDLIDNLPSRPQLQGEAGVLSSCYLKNLGDGNFELEELPKEFQISAIQDFVLHDFNGDGYIDFLGLGNKTGLSVHIGELNASYGVLGMGNGDGTFDYVAPRNLGALLDGEIKDGEWIQMGKNRNLLVGSNQDSLRLYQLNRRSNE